MFYDIDEEKNLLEQYVNADRSDVIRIPDGVRIIGSNVLHGDEDVRELILPDSVEMLRSNAFFGCQNLRRVRFGKGMNRINEHAFGNCPRLSEIEFSEELDYVHPNAFWSTAWEQDNNKGAVVLNNYLYKYIGDDRIIDIPEGVRVIGERAFSYRGMEEVHFPSSLRRINHEAFSNCNDLKEVVLPEGIEVLMSSAFYYCKSVEHIVLPSTLRHLECAFYGVSDALRMEIDIRDEKLFKELFGHPVAVLGSRMNVPAVTYAPYLDVDVLGRYTTSACIGFMELYHKGQLPEGCYVGYRDKVDSFRNILYKLAGKYPFMLSYLCSERLIRPEEVEAVMEQVTDDVAATALLLEYSAGMDRTDYEI